MRLAIIAIQYERRYYSLQCRYDGSPRLLGMLKKRLPSVDTALRFVAQGDIELKIGHGCLLLNKDSIAHASPLSLASYAVNSRASELYVFEQDDWDEIPLEHEVISEIAAK